MLSFFVILLCPMPETPSASAVRLKSLHPAFGIPDVDIRPLVDQVRLGGLAVLDPALDPKVRRNVLTALLTEKMWRHVEAAENDLPDSFGLPSDDIRSLEAAVSADSFPEIIQHFKTATKSHLFVCSELCDFEPDPIVEELKQSSFVDSNGHSRVPYPDRFNAGIDNSNMMSWESIHQLPYVHRRKFGEQSTFSSEQYQAIAKRNVSFLRHLAAAHILIFSAAHSAGRFPPFPAFSPQFLTMTGEGDAMRMGLDPCIEAHIEFRRDKIEATLATGCPALVAKASNGKDVVTAMYEWIQRIADRHFFPSAERILARTDLSDTLGLDDFLKGVRVALVSPEKRSVSSS